MDNANIMDTLDAKIMDTLGTFKTLDAIDVLFIADRNRAVSIMIELLSTAELRLKQHILSVLVSGFTFLTVSLPCYRIVLDLMNDTDAKVRVLAARFIWLLSINSYFPYLNISEDLFVRLCDAVNDGSVSVRQNVKILNLGLFFNGLLQHIWADAHANFVKETTN
jgi:hypothetical protein